LVDILLGVSEDAGRPTPCCFEAESGMNFDYMPELHYPWAYPATLGVMLAVTLYMLVFFRRKRWI